MKIQQKQENAASIKVITRVFDVMDKVINSMFDITLSYVWVIPIDIVGLIDPNYIECYDYTRIPL